MSKRFFNLSAVTQPTDLVTADNNQTGILHSVLITKSGQVGDELVLTSNGEPLATFDLSQSPNSFVFELPLESLVASTNSGGSMIANVTVIYSF